MTVSGFSVGDVILEKFEVTEILGEGGMGVVLAARHRELDELVALKFLLPALRSNPEVCARFAREAKTGIRIKNEHVARVLDVSTLPDGSAFMVMEHLVGEDLATMLARRGALPTAEAVDLLLQACEAIAEAHTLGVVHRDLKPGNLFVTTGSDGLAFVKVLDFGISKTVDMDSVSVTATTTVLGSPLYMSPEQLASSRDVDRRSDIWSLGVILYEMLTGTTPFHGTSFPTLCAAILSGKYVEPSVLRPGLALPGALDSVLAGTLALDRDARIPTVDVLAARIAPFGSEAAVLASSRIKRIAARNPSVLPTRVSAAPASAFDATIPQDSSSPSLLEAASGSLPRGTAAGLARSSAEGTTADRRRSSSSALIGGAVAGACVIVCTAWWALAPGRPEASIAATPAAVGAAPPPPATLLTSSAPATTAPGASTPEPTTSSSPPRAPSAPTPPGPSAGPAPSPHHVAGARPAPSASSHAKADDLFGSQKMSARRARHLTRLGAVVAVVATTALDAAADPTPEDRVAARTLFQDGRELMRSHEYAQACPKLEESQRLDPGIGTLFNVADCYEGLGRVASAWTTFLDVAEAATRAGEADRAVVAKARADALAPRLPRVRVTVAAELRSAVALTLDKSPFAAALVDTAVPVDPGDHVLRADAPGKKHWEAHFQASAAATVPVSVPPLEDAPVALSVALPETVAPRPTPSVPESRRWQVPAAIVTASLGVVGLTVGAISGGIAVSDWSSAKPECANGACATSSAYSSWSAAHSAGVVSTASFVVGGALVAGGAALWLTRPKAAVALGMRPDGVMIVGGRFP